MDNKLEHIIVEYLNKRYGDLTEFKIDDYSNSIFYIKDKKNYMVHNLENGILWVDYATIWSDLKNLFSLEYYDIQSVITKWVEEAHNLRGVTPDFLCLQAFYKVEEAHNLRGVTPSRRIRSCMVWVEEAHNLRGVTPEICNQYS